VITFIREIEHLSFRKALDRLQIEVSLLGRRRRLEKRSE
jgi:hypothetical protein